jgi:ArsR family transcriptional regulator, arsenate/arsenite/antimonite-responsive transcriptional repressor
MRKLIKIFKALSDETRLRILNILLERECCVCEVIQALDISQTRASRNLNMLYDAGLLKVRRNGLWVLYSIDENNIKKHNIVLLETIKKSLDGNNEAIQDKERLKNAQRVGLETICSGTSS